MAAKIISQRKWAKLVASTGPLAQPPGALTRLSNLTFNQRGSLQVCDGSTSIGLVGSALDTYQLAALAAFADLEVSQYPYYVALAYPPSPALTNVAAFAASPVAGSGNSAGTLTFGIVATLGGTHSALQTASFTTLSTFSGVTFSWDAVSGATGYSIYVIYAASPPPHFRQGYAVLLQSVGAVTTSTFSGTLPATPAVTSIPTLNNSYVLQLFTGSPVASGLTYTVAFSAITAGLFPFVGVGPQGARSITGPYPAVIAPGSPQFLPETALPGFSPYGGIVGSAGPLPQIVQFAGQSILILGNGYAPQQADPALGASAPVAPLGNTFQAAYPTWQSGVDWTTGAQLSATSGGTNYLFTATQGGVSGTSAPSWNFTTNAETSDGSVIWTCNGPIAVSIAPLGAAHAVAYAGSLWLANTYPTTTQYAAWQGSTAYIAGQQIGVVDGSGNTWLFQVQTGGTSGSSAPSWTFTAGDTTNDASPLVWYCVEELSPALAAGLDGPSCLKMSDANNPNSWNPVNTAFVGKDDGTQITGLQPFTIAALGISPTGSLCLFKEFTTYQVIGVFGSTSFEIQPAQTNLGCIAPRSIQFIPGFGVCRFSHLGFAVFDGIQDRLISEDIRPYLFGGVDSQADLTAVDPRYSYLAQSAQTIAPPMYLCAMPLTSAPTLYGVGGSLARLFCYDLVMKAWAVVDLPWAITTLSTLAVGEGYPLVVAGKSDGTLQRLQSGDLTWDAGASDQSNVAWSFRSPDIFGEGSSQRLFVEQVVIRGYGNSAMAASIVASLWLDGAQLGAQAIDIVPMGGGNLFELRVAVFRNGERFHLDVSGNNGGAAGVIDSLDWAVTPKSALARRVIG